MLERKPQSVAWPVDVGATIEELRLDRSALIRRGAALALVASPLASVLAACDAGDSAQARTFTAGYLDWILRLHPAIERSVGPTYAAGTSGACHATRWRERQQARARRAGRA